MAQSWRDLRAKMSKGGTKVPESPDGYETAFPDAMSTRVNAILARDEEGNVNDPILKSFREFAHDKGWPQQQFQEAVSWYIDAAYEALPAPLDVDAEIAKVGAGDQKLGQRYIDILGQKVAAKFKAGMLTEAQYNGIMDTMFLDAETITGYAAFLEMQGEMPIPQTLRQIEDEPVLEGMLAKMSKLREDYHAGKLNEDQFNKQMAALQAEAERKTKAA